MRPLSSLVLLAAMLPAYSQVPSGSQVVNGRILYQGRPFPMVLDAGTDCFTPQDYDTVMASKDAWGANTWWLQYSMRHMKSESEGDFSGLTRELDFFEKTGMAVSLYVRGEYRDVPSWFQEKYNDWRMEDPKGKPIGSQICFQHEGYRRLIDSYIRQLARAAKNKKSLLMYSTYDEFGPRGWGCFCKRCVAKYRQHLQAKYPDLAALNSAWQSSYGSWSDIDAPRTQSFDANYGEWQRYRVGVLRDFGSIYYKALKEEDPAHLSWIDINMDLFDYTWRWGVIWWKLTDIFDALNLGPEGFEGNAALRTAMGRAIRDNYGKPTTWHLGFPRNEVNPRPELYSRLFESNHGGVVWWYSFWEVLRGGKAWGSGEDQPAIGNWYAARELNHLARYLGDLYTYSQPARGEVGLFVSSITDLMRSLSPHQALQSEDPMDLAGLAQILRDLNIPYEAISEDQVAKLASFKVIFLGQFSMATDQPTVDAFREYVRRGGTLVVTNRAFSADSNGRAIANPAFGLEDLWGSSGAAGDQLADGRIATASGEQMPSLGGVARRKLGTAQVLAKLPDGSPAITSNRFGKGRVLFLGTNAGEAYNTGNLLTRGLYRMKRGQRLDLPQYQELVRRYEGWENYAGLLRDFLGSAGVTSPVTVDSGLIRKVRVSLQDHDDPERAVRNHLLVITQEPEYDAAAQITSGVAHTRTRSMSQLPIQVRIPAPGQVKAVYRIPPIGYTMGRIDAVPEQIPFQVSGGELRVTVPNVSDAECLLLARDARPLVGVRSTAISTKDGRPTPLEVTVDNAAGQSISGEITFPAGFRAVAEAGASAKFQDLAPGHRYTAQFQVTAPAPIERNRTFQATVRYSRPDGKSGEAASYPVTSRTDERIAWSWRERVEAEMTEAATTPGTPHGPLYEDRSRSGSSSTPPITMARSPTRSAWRAKRWRSAAN
ncbi:MAG: beta-galactosidase [Acidobacteria bacterium]|nr:beta-galactosidase [Acidobacteriota bacterium]